MDEGSESTAATRTACHHPKTVGQSRTIRHYENTLAKPHIGTILCIADAMN